ncbi:MAG TPA: SPOR domain-containing protein [Gammaproteobacteria bacterium]|nr:SPOR domain-containing protein [Gammaproteobacteria bacterium]
MDSKTKHRILGVLVIVGIGVLAYPLLQSNNDMPSEQVLVKAPPFPDQASPLNQGPTPTVAPQPDDAPASAAAPASVAAPALPDSSASSENVTPDEGMRQQPDDVITPSKSSTTVNVKTPEIVSPASQQPAASPEKPTTDDATQAVPSPSSSLEKSSEPENVIAPQPQKQVKLSHQAKRHVKPKTVAMLKTKPAKLFNMPRQDDSNGLLKLNQVAWVIQVGTFKQKGPAMRLVNQLRENGYRAFIQQLPSSDGNNTQVFVGPENRQHLARALATQLQDDMKVKGIVISYQPFNL